MELEPNFFMGGKRFVLFTNTFSYGQSRVSVTDPAKHAEIAALIEKDDMPGLYRVFHELALEQASQVEYA